MSISDKVRKSLEKIGLTSYEIRTYIATAAAAGGLGELQFYTAELPIFAVGVTVGRFDIAA